MIPIPFYVVAESPFGQATEKFTIASDTTFGTFIGLETNARALAVFATIDDAQRFARGRFSRGMAIPIRTTTDAIAFLRELKDKCGIVYLLVDDGDHSTTRKALLVSAAIDWLWSTAGNN